MNNYRIAMIWKSADFLNDFNKQQHKSVWDVIEFHIGQLYPGCTVNKLGGMYQVFWISSNDELEELKDRINQMVLKETGCDKDAFLISAQQVDAAVADRSDTPAVQKSPPISSVTDSHADSSSTQAETRPAREQAPPPGQTNSAPVFSMPDEAVKIERIKSGLMQKIRGQQHAIDEVVQSVFEVDTFRKNDPNRSGPLASFLFAGPSGVGKTYLAKTFAALSGRESLVIDMSEYSDNLANLKFTGGHGEPSVVAGFIRKHPDGIIIFDEIEKAHINTIHLFLQILDEGRLMDMKSEREVSFKDAVVIITTNAGKQLYEDSTVYNLSGISKRVILEALRTDVKESTQEPFFPECITTRFANGRVVLFNHLEPYALMQIVQDELEVQTALFKKNTGIEISYDPRLLSALVLFHAGGTADARTLRSLARSMLVKELQDITMQYYAQGNRQLRALNAIRVNVDPLDAPDEIRELFLPAEDVRGLIVTDSSLANLISSNFPLHADLVFCKDEASLKRAIRGIVDFVIIDPLFGTLPNERKPNDIEDIHSEGMTLFEYLLEYYSDIPIYLLNKDGLEDAAFATLISRGAKGVITIDSADSTAYLDRINELIRCVQINNSVFSLAKGGKVLNYNCAQFTEDSQHALISFDRMSLHLEPRASDRTMLYRPDDTNGIRFTDIIGCKSAKEELQTVCDYMKRPREYILKGLQMGNGILLYGPPGTGKTMLGKAMAFEANAAFFQTTATSFFAPLVGQTEQNIRSLFAKARRYAPSVIFIDEVDAIARTRTGGIGTAHNEDALNTLIAEMDGFSTDSKRPVYVMVATNYDIDSNSARSLDPAFVRRFNKRVFIDLPDEDARCEFLEKALALHKIHFDDAHEERIRNVAAHSAGMSNADLKLVVEAFLRKSEASGAAYHALMESLEDFKYGEIKKTDPDKVRKTAYHEAGHALVSMLLGETPSYLTVVSRGDFGGYMQHSEGKTQYTKDEIMNLICCSLAGRAAEILVYGEKEGINTGASSDLEHAKKLARAALDQYGMGNSFAQSTRADRESILTAQFARAEKLLGKHRTILDDLTELLVTENSLDKKSLRDFAQGKHLLD